MDRCINLVGQRFGRLLVLKRVEDHIFPSGRKGVKYLCKCDCGNQKIIFGSSIKSQLTVSCGCLHKEIISQRKYTKEDLVNILKGLKERKGRITQDIIEFDADTPSTMTFRKAFGSVGNALRAADIEVNKPMISENCKKAHWKGGVIKDNRGYILVRNMDTGKYKREHRIIVENGLGRKLKNYEQVHHINEIKDDNRIENLQVLTISEHTKLHKLAKKSGQAEGVNE